MTGVIPAGVLGESVGELWRRLQHQIKPPPALSVSEWAREYRYLSPEDSKKALLGNPRWEDEGFEYLNGFMDAFSDPMMREISIMKSGQTGFTQAMLNMLGFIIDLAPGPTLVLYPTETNAARFSKRKLDPMLRDSVRLHGRVSEAYRRDGDNSTFEKTFPGGFISIVSAKSVNNLSMQSIMYLFVDELDRIDRTAGNEGDTVEVVSKRLQGFREVSKQVNISTPTIRHNSRIEAKFEHSSKQRFFLPCTHCGGYQTLKWGQVKGWRIAKGVYKPEETYYECELCAAHLGERDKYVMLKNGKWIAEHPERREHAGFHISELYSTLSTWVDIVKEFVVKKDNPFLLQTFVNLTLGEVWEDSESEIPEGMLMGRKEEYGGTGDEGRGEGRMVPEGAVVLTGAVDVQKDRVEVGIKGWGLGEESWLIDYQVFYGDVEMPFLPEANNVWYKLEQFLAGRYYHEAGVWLRLQAVGIDTGYATTSVQRFVKRQNKLGRHWVFALQGDKGQQGAPILNRGSKNNKRQVKQFVVGTATAKNIILSRLNIEEYGPGYMHFPMWVDEEYFKQLTAEKPVTEYKNGIAIGKRWKKIRARNEALDIEVYNIAAFDFMNVNLEAVARNFQESTGNSRQSTVDSRQEALEESKEGTRGEGRGTREAGGRKRMRLVRRGNFVSSW